LLHSFCCQLVKAAQVAIRLQLLDCQLHHHPFVLDLLIKRLGHLLDLQFSLKRLRISFYKLPLVVSDALLFVGAPCLNH
jgi:hypothetical protein